MSKDKRSFFERLTGSVSLEEEAREVLKHEKHSAKEKENAAENIE